MGRGIRYGHARRHLHLPSKALGYDHKLMLEGRKNKVFCIARHVRVARIIFVPFIALPTERTDDGVFASDFDFVLPLLWTHE